MSKPTEAAQTGYAGPLYLRIAVQLRQRIERGEWLEGERLPTVRELAKELKANPHTLNRAFRQLQDWGLVSIQVGRGTTICAPPVQQPLAGRWQSLIVPDLYPTENFQRQVSPAAAEINLASNRAGRVPTEELAAAARLTLEDPEVFGSEDRCGYWPLRSWLAGYHSRQGMRCGAEQVIVTSGAQQALLLIARVLLSPGDSAIVESPTYHGALNAFQSTGARLLPAPVDEQGIRTDVVQFWLERHKPKLIFVTPSFNNPTGHTISPDRRQELLRLASEHNCFIVEDGVPSELRYDGADLAPMKAHDGDGHVLYLKSFSKLVAPGLRIGWIVASGPIRDYLAEAKHLDDLHAPSITQRLLHRFLAFGALEPHIHAILGQYRARRDATLAALSEQTAELGEWTRPSGGMTLWLSLPTGVRASAVVREASLAGVAVANGRIFQPASAAREAVRISFAVETPAGIREGIRRLANAITTARQRGAAVPSSVPVHPLG